jgi:hypothetical protein
LQAVAVAVAVMAVAVVLVVTELLQEPLAVGLLLSQHYH